MPAEGYWLYPWDNGTSGIDWCHRCKKCGRVRYFYCQYCDTTYCPLHRRFYYWFCSLGCRRRMMPQTIAREASIDPSKKHR